MSDPSRLQDASSADEEIRYRAVGALDPGLEEERALLVERLADPSWRVRAAVVERLGGARDPGPLVEVLASALVSPEGTGARDAAGAALARIGAPSVPALLSRLSDGSADLRQAAATVLGQIGDRRSAGPLAGLLADADPNVRVAAVDALARVGGSEATAALRRVLEAGEPVLRLSAVEGLARLRAWPEGLPVEALLADPALRRPAFRLLGACDDPGVSGPVAAGLADRSRSAREAALAAVGQQRSRRGPEALAGLAAAVREVSAHQPGVVDWSAAALASEEPFVVLGALTVLSWAGSGRHAAAMLRLAEDGRLRTVVEESLEALPQDAELRSALAAALPELGPVARVTALAALARMDSPAALESLVREASDPEAYVQAEAVAALGRLADLRVVAPLAGMLADPQLAMADVAAGALVQIGRARPEVAAAVLAALRARAGAHAPAALLRVLGALGDEGDLAPVLSALTAGAPARRVAAVAAVAALARRGQLPPRPLPALVAALADEQGSVRAGAARAFAELGRAQRSSGAAGVHPADAAAEGPLLAALTDPVPDVRAAAAEALGAFPGDGHAPALAALLADEGAVAPVVAAALRSLAALGPPPAGAVARAAGHPDAEVVKEAVAIAAVLPGAEGERVLAQAARDPRWDVRLAAAGGLTARADRSLASLAASLADEETDPLVARAFHEAARALGPT
jgi:HEAT repeat protein